MDNNNQSAPASSPPAWLALASPYLTTAEAAQYLRYRSTSGIDDAVVRRDLSPAGIEPRNTHLFIIDELNRFFSRHTPRYGTRSHGMLGQRNRAGKVIKGIPWLDGYQWTQVPEL